MLKIFVLLLLLSASQVLADQSFRFCKDLTQAVNSTEPFRGVTIFRAPFVEKDNVTGKLRGFFVDLLDEMAQVGSFNYTLRNLEGPISSLDSDQHRNFIRTFQSNAADFGIGHTLTENPNPFYGANYTRPYIVSSSSALVRKSLLKQNNITNFDELIELLSKQPTPTEIGWIGGSVILKKDAPESFSIERGTDYILDSEAGLQRVLNKQFVFIQASFLNELEVNKNCSLIHLPLKSPTTTGSGKRPMFRFVPANYAIAVNNCFRHQNVIHEAFQKVEESGKLEELRRKYLNRKCDPGTVSNTPTSNSA